MLYTAYFIEVVVIYITLFYLSTLMATITRNIITFECHAELLMIEKHGETSEVSDVNRCATF